jgi:predicted nucleic acid-binding protein
VIRAVVDPSVFVSAFIGDPNAGSGRLVAAWRERRFVLVVSPLLLAELGKVLSRPKFARWASDGRGDQPDPAQPSSPLVRDPDDDYLVALMHATGADVLVSLDRDLLDAELDGITVTDPAVFVSSLEQTGN